MSKKSGLADSPFFSTPLVEKEVFRRSNNQAKEPAKPRSDEQAAARTPDRANARTGERVNTRPAEQTNRRTGDQVTGRTGERPITRHSFNFYKDQVLSLKRLKMQRELAGNSCHLSDLVREALDTYLKDKLPEQANG